MEPMAAFVKRDVKNQYPWAPLGFRPEEALWRQSAALFRFAADGKPAATLAWLRTLRQNRYLDDSQRQLALFGLSSDRAKISSGAKSGSRCPWPTSRTSTSSRDCRRLWKSLARPAGRSGQPPGQWPAKRSHRMARPTVTACPRWPTRWPSSAATGPRSTRRFGSSWLNWPNPTRPTVASPPRERGP